MCVIIYSMYTLFIIQSTRLIRIARHKVEQQLPKQIITDNNRTYVRPGAHSVTAIA